MDFSPRIEHSCMAIVALAIALSLFFFQGASLSCLADTSASEQLRQALIAAKILGEDNSLRVAINGSEAIISTYESGKTSNPDNQCKILALLFGKTAFETNDKLAKIKACFYAKDQNSYRQVMVTVGDVEAFGSGASIKRKH